MDAIRLSILKEDSPCEVTCCDWAMDARRSPVSIRWVRSVEVSSSNDMFFSISENTLLLYDIKLSVWKKCFIPQLHIDPTQQTEHLLRSRI